MISRFQKKSNVVLSDDTDKIVAIIACKKGINSIKEQIELAIKEDVGAADVVVADSYDISLETIEPQEFSVHIYDADDSDEADYYATYTITIAATY